MYGNSEIIVLSGPFKGLKYINTIVWGSITPKWLGSYEAELHDVIEEIIQNQYNTIIDVGCAEGYYVLGLASRLPQARIYAFDIDFISRKQVLKIARLNNLAHQIVIGNYLTHELIEEVSKGKTLLISDIEGYERNLLNPEQCAKLKKIDILVELHNTKETPDIESLIKDRFKVSHDIVPIKATSRDGWLKNFIRDHETAQINANMLKRATDEFRMNSDTWYWMRSKHKEL